MKWVLTVSELIILEIEYANQPPDSFCCRDFCIIKVNLKIIFQDIIFEVIPKWSELLPIQPPIMKLLTTKKERAIVMKQLRKVSKVEKVVFPVFVVLFCSLLLPSVAPLLGMLMLGNLFRESGVVERLSDTAQNALCNIVTIMLGTTVGATADGEIFLRPQTIAIIVMGLIAFCFSTVGGVLLGKLLCHLTGGKINPLIGSAGVSAVPMAARVSQTVGSKENPTNFLLMHAMGPNVAGVIGTAVAAGTFMAIFGVK